MTRYFIKLNKRSKDRELRTLAIIDRFLSSGMDVVNYLNTIDIYCINQTNRLPK